MTQAHVVLRFADHDHGTNATQRRDWSKGTRGDANPFNRLSRSAREHAATYWHLATATINPEAEAVVAAEGQLDDDLSTMWADDFITVNPVEDDAELMDLISQQLADATQNTTDRLRKLRGNGYSPRLESHEFDDSDLQLPYGWHFITVR